MLKVEKRENTSLVFLFKYKNTYLGILKMIINIIIHIYPDEPIDLELFLFLLSLVLWHLSALELHSETRTKIIYSLKYRANIHCTCI